MHKVRVRTVKIGILFWLLGFVGLVGYAYGNDNIVQWQKNGVATIQWGKTNINIALQAQCGLVSDRALYASFGLELQIFRCQKLIIPTWITYAQSEHVTWLGRIDYAPWYDSIRRIDAPVHIYNDDSAGRPINGGTPYVDWYKNLGSELFYLGNMPFVNLWIGVQYRTNFGMINRLQIGRLEGLNGIKHAYYGSDAKFAPLAYWLSKDLFSGMVYTLMYSPLTFSAGLFSGNNPLKGGGWYLNGIQSPNLKANNTPTYNTRIALHKWHVYTFFAYRFDRSGSTYTDTLKDGKRVNDLYTTGVGYDNQIGSLYIQVFLRYTIYQSGLWPQSIQNNGSAKYKTITQKGFYTGGFIRYGRIGMGMTYEQFQRFDSRVYEKYGYESPVGAAQKKLTDFSLLARYKINTLLTVEGNYMWINNPYQWVSDILDTKGDNRFQISFILGPVPDPYVE